MWSTELGRSGPVAVPSLTQSFIPTEGLAEVGRFLVPCSLWSDTHFPNFPVNPLLTLHPREGQWSSPPLRTVSAGFSGESGRDPGFAECPGALCLVSVSVHRCQHPQFPGKTSEHRGDDVTHPASRKPRLDTSAWPCSFVVPSRYQKKKTELDPVIMA